MLGTFLWNTGALWADAPFNLIDFVPDEGSLASSDVRALSAVEIGMHGHEVLAANRLGAFGDDFYNRFHITTLVLSLGNLVSDQTEQVTIWNAFRRAWTLDSITLENGEGITTAGQPDPPLQFNPLQERTYDLGITADGPAQIDASISWNFSNGQAVVLDITGQRVIPWNWQPDWSAGIIERLQWYTDVIPAERGEEQRRSLRIDPRQFVEFTSYADASERPMMESMLWGWGARVWAIPLWFDGQDLTSALASGATSIPLDSSSRGFEVGGLVLITDGNPRNFEALEIEALSSSITLKRPTAKTWAQGARVYPARTAVLENLATVQRFTGQCASVRLQWRMLDPTTWTAAATPTYRDMPVLEERPDWSEDPTLAFERKVSVLDADTGLTAIEDRAEMPLTLQRLLYALNSRAEIDTWKKRLWALRGKQVSIWIPTWSDDLTVVALIGDGALSIDVEWLGYTKYLKQDPGRRDIRIQLVDGTVFYRRITGSAEVSDTVERLSIETALGVTVNPADVLLVSFMALSRSDSDQHELNYFTGDVANTAFNARIFRTAL